MAQKTSPLLALAVEYVLLSTILLNPNNVMIHPEDQLRKLMEGILEFGFLVPILVDGDGMILSGHGRYEAALRLGLDRVPIVRVGHLKPKQVRAFMLADNKLSRLSRYDMGKLAAEFDYLLRDDDTYSIRTSGFDVIEVDRTLGREDAPAAEEAVELPADDVVPVSRMGAFG